MGILLKSYGQNAPVLDRQERLAKVIDIAKQFEYTVHKGILGMLFSQIQAYYMAPLIPNSR